MNFLYHKIPEHMVGKTLHPLNELKEIDRKSFDNASQKYLEREDIQKQVIPYLNCLWNGVLHFSPIHPKEIQKAFRDAGDNFEGDFYEVDPNLLDVEKTIVYLYKHQRPEDKLLEDNFAQFNPDEIEQYSHLSEETIQDYRKLLSEGKRPFPYHRVAHILYMGTLDVTNIPIIRV